MTGSRRWDRRVALGALCGLAAVALPWLVLKPNRVVSGTPLASWQAVSPAGLAAFVLLWALALAVARRDALPRLRPAAIALIAVWAPFLQVGLALWTAGPTASQAARISLGPGVYLAAFGSYLMMISQREPPRSRWAQAAAALMAVGLGLLALTGRLGSLAVLKELRSTGGRFWVEAVNHLALTGTAVAAAAVIGIPLGTWATRNRLVARVVLFAVDSVQTVPSLALFGLIIVPLAWLSFRFPVLRALGVHGIGAAPALLALTLYALLPIVRNTYTGLTLVPRSILEAGRGMGMNALQLLAWIELPLALRLMLSGLRIAAVQTVGNTTVAALVGAGGFGVFVFQGLGEAATDLVLLGALPVVILAVASDRALAALVDLLAPVRETPA